jgi:hypothetical protein
MIVKTKKYQLPKNTYIKMALMSVFREQWWVALIYLALNLPAFLLPSWWWFIGSTIGLVIYILFWLIQFAGATQLEQFKMLFDKLSYEIDSRQILIKINTKQGMPMKWENIKRVKVSKEAFTLFVNKAQIIHLPFKIFNSDNELKFMETILKRKGYIKEA